jgi:thymidylate synthase ThyX
MSLESLRSFSQIEVGLVGAIRPPYEIAVASARTCYSGRGIVLPDQVSKDEKAVALRDKIASSTLEAGHLTTRQHAHFTFAISGVSRQFIWSFLHSHPFYNSEQVSQRYVKVKPGNFLMPPLEEAHQALFLETVAAQAEGYERLIGLLRAPLEKDFFERFRARKAKPELWTTAIDKRAYEVARYALGVGTTAYLYHTISALTLLRYSKLVQAFETPAEQKVVIDQMLARVKEIDPLFEKELQDPIPLESTLEYQFFQSSLESRRDNAEAFTQAFDASLDGHVSKLVSWTSDAEKNLAAAIRVALGLLPSQRSDAELIDLLLDPKANRNLADTLNIGTFDRLSQLLHHVQFTFHKKISHTADSQDQRHRMVMSSRPALSAHYSGKPDFITPFGITQSAEAEDLYQSVMERSFRAINQLLDAGVSHESAFYLLPNAFPIRMVSTGDLQAYHHKWKLRTCYNAQEEIFRASVDEITQVKALFPKLAEHLRAPCYLRFRAGTKPHCPEGDRFCGMPVWKFDISQYTRKSL